MMNKRFMYWIVLILFILQQTSCVSKEPTEEDYGDGVDYDYENSGETTEEVPSTISEVGSSTLASTPVTIAWKNDVNVVRTTTTVPFVPAQLAGVFMEKAEQPIEVACPEHCKCSDVFHSVDCTHQQLQEIPKNIPLNVQRIDLSFNRLTVLNVSDLVNYRELRELILNSNQIQTIVDNSQFQQLPELEYIDLSANALKPLQGTEFTKAEKLFKLSLSNNTNLIQPNIPIVVASKLNSLYLMNCDIEDFSENAFQNLSSLTALDLRENPLNMNLNARAFRYLVNLRELHMPPVSPSVFLELCNLFVNIDVINLKDYDLSCFELTAGSKFEEATIKTGQSTPDDTSNELYKFVTPVKQLETAPSATSTTTVSPESGFESISEPRVPSSGQQLSPISQNETLRNTTNSNTEEQPEVKQSRVDVPQEIINLLLIGLIAFTLLALMIGIICRLDVCGIKTKCCRRSQNRATTEDRVQPHEEIPLNKV